MHWIHSKRKCLYLLKTKQTNMLSSERTPADGVSKPREHAVGVRRENALLWQDGRAREAPGLACGKKGSKTICWTEEGLSQLLVKCTFIVTLKQINQKQKSKTKAFRILWNSVVLEYCCNLWVIQDFWERIQKALTRLGGVAQLVKWLQPWAFNSQNSH